MRDKNGNLLNVGDPVVVTGTIDCINGEASVVIRPSKGVPFYAEGLAVLKVEVPTATEVVEVTPEATPEPTVTLVTEHIVPITPTETVVEPTPTATEITDFPPPPPITE